MTALAGYQGGYGTSLNVMTTAKANLRSATKGKNGAMKGLTTEVRALVRKIQGNPAVTVALKASLGINTRDTPRVNTPPTKPTSLVATPDGAGINSLTWNRNGNKSGTVFVVEVMTGGATSFTFVKNTSKTKFDHTGQTPGATATYRVTATRAAMSSQPSAPAVVYPSAPKLTLQLAA